MQETVFFQAGGMGLVLWSEEKLAADSGATSRREPGFRGVALAQNAHSRSEVDAVIAAAESGGAITIPDFGMR